MAKCTLFFTLIILFVFNVSCASQQQLMTLKPEPDTANPLVYDHVPSYINVPVSIKLKDIENKINSILKGLIYEDKTIEADDIEIKIWKQAPIAIQHDAKSANKIKILLFTIGNNILRIYS